jgi:putative toxin-antitoxin system antitoxin component (TIGR02293 family)
MYYIWCKIGLMENYDEKPTSASIYDWLEKPVLRTPGFKKLYPDEHDINDVTQVNEVGFYPEIKIDGSKSAFFTTHVEGNSKYNIKIKPMLQPQIDQPEFFMNNHLKALMAQKGISKVSFESFKNRAGLDYNQMALLLSVARNTLINKKGEELFDVTISEKLISLAEVYTHGFDVFGSENTFIEWLNAPNRALGMVTPFSLLQTQYGRQEVQNVLGRIEWGVYS